MDDDALAPGWQIWNEEPTKLVLAYRPDVFDGSSLPPECMPMLHLTRGKRSRRPGGRRIGDEWYVTLYLEPEVDDGGQSFESKAAAEAAARERATAFVDGEVDYRALYQVPREAYFERLDELVGERP